MVGKNSKGERETVKINVYERTKELGKIIGCKGTTAILYLLDERPRQYTELDSKLELSHATFLRQLNMLKILNLIETKSIKSKRRKTHIYDLTDRGVELMKFINSYEKEIKLPLEQQKIPEISEN